MENILHVVKERDIAFNLLETGESKEIIPYKCRAYYINYYAFVIFMIILIFLL